MVALRVMFAHEQGAHLNQHLTIRPMTTDNRLYYYVSLPYYGHRVYKCCGHGAEDVAHRAFYVPHFEQHGTGNSPIDKGPSSVVVLPFMGNRIEAAGDGWTEYRD